ncbi:MAG: twin-arginine translocation signal domain-containing protein, partial [Deltaproteobacteria bacterium]|nr:twin-arginine translocation signal domain-containing protein [Deltaproteobacteria bacterium]
MNLNKKINRRKFLGTSAALACTAMLPPVVTAGEEQESPSKDLQVLKEYHPLVNSVWINKGQHLKSSDLVSDMLDS